ncbi:hypothetical protein [Neomoorella glycerini]|uniref:hypothetical protein n=1 Tax=Neomoorella glycerini TaxID=55779 RepID=UPI0012E2A351|nr:hypothetical protein [Moorella glycerini]
MSDVGYQAPVILLAAVASLALAYGCFWWRQKELTLDYPCLALLVGNQEEFLEGLLRRFWWWCYWYGSPWRLVVITDAQAKATLAILRHFFYPYPFCRLIYAGEEALLTMEFTAGAGGRQAHFLDIRTEQDFNSAWTRICRTCLKK